MEEPYMPCRVNEACTPPWACTPPRHTHPWACTPQAHTPSRACTPRHACPLGMHVSRHTRPPWACTPPHVSNLKFVGTMVRVGIFILDNYSPRFWPSLMWPRMTVSPTSQRFNSAWRSRYLPLKKNNYLLFVRLSTVLFFCLAVCLSVTLFICLSVWERWLLIIDCSSISLSGG